MTNSVGIVVRSDNWSIRVSNASTISLVTCDVPGFNLGRFLVAVATSAIRT